MYFTDKGADCKSAFVLLNGISFDDLDEDSDLGDSGVALTDICVVERTKKPVDDRSFEELRVATMHRVKGLEFKCAQKAVYLTSYGKQSEFL